MADDTRPTTVDPGEIAGRYSELETTRATFLERARACSELTIPTLIPPEGKVQDLPTPYQSVGARGVNNLGAKTLLALYPPEAPFFRLSPSKAVLKDAARAAGGEEVLSEAEQQLSDVEQEVQRAIEGAGQRPTLFTALRHVIVGGNGLLHVMPDNRLQFFPLSQYVVVRDLQGNLLEIIVKQSLKWRSLPAEVRTALEKSAPDELIPKDGKADIDLYTRVWLDSNGRMWKIVQECCGLPIESTRGSYVRDKLPWIVLRWTEVPGEDYGRSHVEEYIGDLYALEGLSKALVEGAIGSSKLNFFVDPAGQTTKRAIQDADNLDIIDGNAKDVSTLQAEKFADLRVAREAAEAIELRLSQAFLLSAAVQRQAERVTAEEVRYLVAELESSLGGIYSLLSKDFQRPLVIAVLHNLVRLKKVPALSPGTVDLHIITGLDALGRSTDQRNLIQFLAVCKTSLGDKFIEEWIDGETAGKRLAVASRIEPDGLIRTAKQVQQTRQAAQMQELRTKLGPQVIKTAGDQLSSGTPPATG